MNLPMLMPSSQNRLPVASFDSSGATMRPKGFSRLQRKVKMVKSMFQFAEVKAIYLISLQAILFVIALSSFGLEG